MINKIQNATMSNTTRHGGPYDRGSADAYYNRPFNPHYFEGATYSSKEITRDAMTKDEIAAYTAGFKGENPKNQTIER